MLIVDGHFNFSRTTPILFTSENSTHMIERASVEISEGDRNTDSPAEKFDAPPIYYPPRRKMGYWERLWSALIGQGVEYEEGW